MRKKNKTAPWGNGAMPIWIKEFLIQKLFHNSFLQKNENTTFKNK